MRKVPSGLVIYLFTLLLCVFANFVFLPHIHAGAPIRVFQDAQGLWVYLVGTQRGSPIAFFEYGNLDLGTKYVDWFNYSWDRGKYLNVTTFWAIVNANKNITDVVDRLPPISSFTTSGPGTNPGRGGSGIGPRPQPGSGGTTTQPSSGTLSNSTTPRGSDGAWIPRSGGTSSYTTPRPRNNPPPRFGGGPLFSGFLPSLAFDSLIGASTYVTGGYNIAEDPLYAPGIATLSITGDPLTATAVTVGSLPVTGVMAVGQSSINAADDVHTRQAATPDTVEFLATRWRNSWDSFSYPGACLGRYRADNNALIPGQTVTVFETTIASCIQREVDTRNATGVHNFHSADGTWSFNEVASSREAVTACIRMYCGSPLSEEYRSPGDYDDISSPSDLPPTSLGEGDGEYIDVVQPATAEDEGVELVLPTLTTTLLPTLAPDSDAQSMGYVPTPSPEAANTEQEASPSAKIQGE